MSTASPEFPGTAAQFTSEGYTRASGKATWALVLGIGSFVLLPLLASIGAIMLSREARREIAADPNLTGEGRAKAGAVLAWINIGLSALFIAFVIAGIVIGATGG